MSECFPGECVVAKVVFVSYNASRCRRSALKKEIHPDYHEIEVVMTDGTTYSTRSTWGAPGDTLKLDIDSKSHPAWTGGSQRLVDTAGQVAKFNNRFKDLGID